MRNIIWKDAVSGTRGGAEALHKNTLVNQNSLRESGVVGNITTQHLQRRKKQATREVERAAGGFEGAKGDGHMNDSPDIGR
jgi:hypothetical protein